MYQISDYSLKQALKLGVTIKPSANKNKKIDVFKDSKKVASIGAINYNDYPTYLKNNGLKYADKQKNYIRQGMKETVIKLALMVIMLIKYCGKTQWTRAGHISSDCCLTRSGRFVLTKMSHFYVKIYYKCGTTRAGLTRNPFHKWDPIGFFFLIKSFFLVGLKKISRFFFLGGVQF